MSNPVLGHTHPFPPPYPVFTWLTWDDLTTPAGQPWRLLAIDPAAAMRLTRDIGIRAWRILEVLALNSRMDSERHAHVYRGSIPRLIELARGSDPQDGYGKDTLRPILQNLKNAGYLQIEIGRARGRGKGQDGSDYILTHDLFFGLPMVMPSISTSTNEWYRDPLVDQSFVPAEGKTYQRLGDQGAALPHKHEMDDVHNREVLPRVEDRDRVSQYVHEQLRTWGWATNVDSLVQEHSLEIICAWIIHIISTSGIDNPGAFLRSKLGKNEIPPSFSYSDDCVFYLVNNQLRLTSAQAKQEQELPRVRELMAALENLSPEVAQDIRDQAATSKTDDTDNPSLLWRQIVSEELRTRGITL